jgi:glycosyltransferase involved in cell wall biosynthesis
MDDCSPDDTRHVTRSFSDKRLTYVRNEANLGALRNYNKGIALSRGKYIWLLSADDYLRRPYILKRYVDLMERNPAVAYTFCPGMAVRGSRENRLLSYSSYGKRDRIVNGHVFLKRLLSYNLVLAPSAMARRECYETIGDFPVNVNWAGQAIDLIWGGDWLLWCLFALQYDVGYFAEPMVCYREHEQSMTNHVTQARLENCAAADIAVLWMVRERAQTLGLRHIPSTCLNAIAREYARHCVSKEYRWLEQRRTSSMTLDEFEDSLCRNTSRTEERDFVRARTYSAIADLQYWRGNRKAARDMYLSSLDKDPMILRAYSKLLLLHMGKPGSYLRGVVGSMAGH